MRIGAKALVDDRVDEAITSDARTGRMRVVAHEAVQRMVQVTCEVDHVRGPGPFRGRVFVAHVRPVEDDVGALAVHAHRVGRGGRLRQEPPLVVGGRVEILQHRPRTPCRADTVGDLGPVLVLETATVGTVNDQMVDQHEGMAARLRMLERKAVLADQRVETGRPADRARLLDTGMRLVAYRHERVELRHVAGRAGLVVLPGHRPLTHLAGAGRLDVLARVMAVHTVDRRV